MISSTLFSVMNEQGVNIATLITAVIAVLAWVFPFPNIGENKNDKNDQQEKAPKRNYFLKYRIIVFLICIAVLGVLAYKSFTTSEDPVANTLPPQETELISTPEITPTPTAEVTPTLPYEDTAQAAPGIKDIQGCNSGVMVPSEIYWLSQYEYKVIRTKRGVRAYLRYTPDLDDGYFDYVNEGTPVVVLARQDGASLVKVKDGVIGWIGSELLNDE